MFSLLLVLGLELLVVLVRFNSLLSFLLIILDVVFIYLIEKVYVKILYRKDDVNG